MLLFKFIFFIASMSNNFLITTGIYSNIFIYINNLQDKSFVISRRRFIFYTICGGSKVTKYCWMVGFYVT